MIQTKNITLPLFSTNAIFGMLVVSWQLSYCILDGYQASLGFSIMHQVHVLNPPKAQGSDGIPPWFLNTYAAQLAPILQNIFQLSVDSSQVPEAWKNANVTAIYKKGSRAEAANYRPISLTSVASKLLEHIIHSHVMRHLEKHNILTDSQHGFRAKRSTETQLIQTIHDISKSLDK